MASIQLTGDTADDLDRLLAAAQALMRKAELERENSLRYQTAERAAKNAILDFKLDKLDAPAAPTPPLGDYRLLAKQAGLNPKDPVLQAKARAALDQQWNSINAAEAAERQSQQAAETVSEITANKRTTELLRQAKQAELAGDKKKSAELYKLAWSR